MKEGRRKSSDIVIGERVKTGSSEGSLLNSGMPSPNDLCPPSWLEERQWVSNAIMTCISWHDLIILFKNPEW